MTAAALGALGEDCGDKEPRAPARVTPTRRSKRGAVVRGGRAASTPRRSNDDDDNPTDSASKLVSSDNNSEQLCLRTRAKLHGGIQLNTTIVFLYLETGLVLLLLIVIHGNLVFLRLGVKMLETLICLNALALDC